ncbi:hypothetical protein C1886_23065 [Pseudomonas sp. FW300-N1A1]|nr:hypothetical protein C1886_23065 [Pseudomonas sp. FW300-N1A1]
MTVTPAPSEYGAARVLQTQYLYAGYQGLEGRGTWLALAVETLTELNRSKQLPLQRTAFSYIDAPNNPFEHGRKLRDEVTFNGETTTTAYQYGPETFARTGEAVLRTDSETIGFDDQSAQSVRKRITLLDSLLSGESLRTHDDTNVEIDYEYDLLRRVTKETVAPNSTQYKASRTYTYTLTNDVGQRAKQTACDVKGVVTTTELDGFNRVIEESRQDADTPGFDRNAEPRKIYRASYNNREQVIRETVIDWEGLKDVSLTSLYSYDDWGEQRRVIRPDAVEEYEVTDPITRTTTQWLGIKDEEGEDREVRGKIVTTNNLFDKPDSVRRYHLGDDPSALGTRSYSEHVYHYDGMGRTAEEFDAVGNWTTYEYDAFDRMIRTRLPDYNEVEREYAAHSREDLPIKISVNGRVLGEQAFDGLDRMTQSITGGRVSVYSFDPGQTQPKRVKRPSGVETDYVYRPELGEDPEQRIALESTAIYEYDAENARLRKTAEVDADGITHNLVRDYFSTGELKSERREQRREGAAGAFESFEMHYGYSRLARLLSYTDVLGQTQTYTYDEEKNARLIATRLGNTESTFTYDEAGELTKIDTCDGMQRLITELEYDDFGREVLRTFHLGNGITQTLSQTYDEVDRLTQRTLAQRVEGGADETLRDEMYSYDERGRLVFYDCSGSQPPVDPYGKAIKSQMFGFDAQDNLDFVETTFEGGRHSIYFEYENEHDPCQLTGLRNELSPPRPGDPDYPDRIDFPYDADGNLLRDEVGRLLAYDSLGRLSSVSADTADDYDYDPLDRLSGARHGGTQERRFYRGDDLANRIQGADSSTFVRADGIVLAEHQAGADPKSLLLAGDEKNSVLCEVSQDARKHLKYMPYGYCADDALVSSCLGFNGELREAQTNSYLLGNGHRAYSSQQMRFQSPDRLSPFGRGGWNTYTYCGNDPINFLDETGGYRFLHWLAKRMGLPPKAPASKVPRSATPPSPEPTGEVMVSRAYLNKKGNRDAISHTLGKQPEIAPSVQERLHAAHDEIHRGGNLAFNNPSYVGTQRTRPPIDEMSSSTSSSIVGAPTSSRPPVTAETKNIRQKNKKPNVISKAMQRRYQ